MLNKVKRFLLRQKEVEFSKKSDKSDSLYFTVGNQIIRLSDHIPTSNCRPEQLHIIIPANSESFTIIVNNRIAIIPNYSKLKEYIKFYILTVGVMGRTVHSTVITEKVVKRIKEVEKETIIPVYKEMDESLSKRESNLLADFRRVSPVQQSSLINYFSQIVNSKAAKKYRKDRGIL